jgi:hypothetical protein
MSKTDDAKTPKKKVFDEFGFVSDGNKLLTSV